MASGDQAFVAGESGEIVVTELDGEGVPSPGVVARPTAPEREASLAGRTEEQMRVVLVDDHLLFRQPLAFLLGHEPDITVVGQAGTVAEARPLLPQADIVLIDLDLPDGEGVTLLHELRTVRPQAIALVLTGSGSPVAMARAVEAGAAGVIHKSRPVRDVVDAIRRLHAGEPLLSVRETIELLRLISQQRDQGRAAQAVIDRLTPREREVLHALAAGSSDREIADQLLVCLETVRTHMVNVLAKLGVDSRLKALVFALKHGLVTIEGTGGDYGLGVSDAGDCDVPHRARAHGAWVVRVPTPAPTGTP